MGLISERMQISPMQSEMLTTIGRHVASIIHLPQVHQYQKKNELIHHFNQAITIV